MDLLPPRVQQQQTEKHGEVGCGTRRVGVRHGRKARPCHGGGPEGSCARMARSCCKHELAAHAAEDARGTTSRGHCFCSIHRRIHPRRRNLGQVYDDADGQDPRRFEDFRELQLSDNGKRTKRPSLGELRALLESVGLGDRFERVFPSLRGDRGHRTEAADDA